MKTTVILDHVRHEVKVNGKEIYLSPKQYRLLKALIESNGDLMTRKQLVQFLGTKSQDDNCRSVDQYISRLRKTGIKNILTVPDFGYRWIANDAA